MEFFAIVPTQTQHLANGETHLVVREVRALGSACLSTHLESFDSSNKSSPSLEIMLVLERTEPELQWLVLGLGSADLHGFVFLFFIFLVWRCRGCIKQPSSWHMGMNSTSFIYFFCLLFLFDFSLLVSYFLFHFSMLVDWESNKNKQINKRSRDWAIQKSWIQTRLASF